MLDNKENDSPARPETPPGKRNVLGPVILILLIFIAGGILGWLGIRTFAGRLLSGHPLTFQTVSFPWDPLAWDTLRDAPLSYRSLGDEGEFLPLYKNLVKDPSLIGFKPDPSYFSSVLSLIRKDHVKKIPDSEIRKGIESELGKLLKESGSKEKPDLAGFDVNGTLVTRLVERYGNEAKSDLIVLASLRGLLRSVKDPYTTLMAPREYTMLQERLQEKSFGGVGIYIELDRENKNQLTVVEPIEGTPAFQAGVHSGDVIEKINGDVTKDMTLEGAVAKMRGPVGTDVTLSLKRKGTDSVKDFKLTRAAINVPSVSYRLLDGGVGYVRLRMFGGETAHELERALDNLRNGIPPAEEVDPDKIREVKHHKPTEPARAIILDLRNNGGGYLNAAVDISSKFLGTHKTVFKRLDGTGGVRDFHTVKTRTVTLPLVVLVNRYSASSSEIVAGALQDNKAGILMGDRTFGKGSVQQIYNLKDGCALKLTVSYFLTPTGRIINKKGLKPDVYVNMKPNQVGKENDVQLQEAISHLRKSPQAATEDMADKKRR